MTNEQFVADLRKVADFFEAHPDFPLPYELRVDVWTYDKKDFSRAVRALGGGEKKYFNSVFSVRRLFGEVQLDVNIAWLESEPFQCNRSERKRSRNGAVQSRF